MIGHQLIEGIDAQRLYPGQTKEFSIGAAFLQLREDLLGTRISIAIGRSQGSSLRIQTHIVDRPAINANGRDVSAAFCAARQPDVQLFNDAVQFPAERTLKCNRRVGKAMNQIDARHATLPFEQRDATALRSQVHRNDIWKIIPGHADSPLAHLPEECV